MDDDVVHETGDLKAHKDDHTPNTRITFIDHGYNPRFERSLKRKENGEIE